MRYLPVLLDLRGRPCVVIGGGSVALQKCETLSRAGADLVVVSPTVVPALASLLESPSLRYIRREYRPGDLAGAFLAIVATTEAAVQQAVWLEAQERGVLINVVDRPDLCTFVMPAILAQEELILAVSTSGSCPGFAAALRDRIGNQLGPEYGRALAIARSLRTRWKLKRLAVEERRRRVQLLLDDDFLSALRSEDWPAVKRHVAMIEGEEIPLPVGDHGR